MKFCTQCQTEKPRSEFSQNLSRYDDIDHICKKCKVRLVREWRHRTGRHKPRDQYLRELKNRAKP